LCDLEPTSAGEPLELEVEKDGSIALYSVTVNQLQKSHGSTGRMIIMRDITAERQAEDTLRRLARITTSISAAHDVESVVRTTVERTADLLPADLVVGMISNPLIGELEILHIAGEPQPGIEQGKPIQRSRLFGNMDQTQVFDLAAGEDAQDTLMHTLVEGGLSSVITQPVATGTEAYGLLLIARATPESLGSAEVELLSAIGGHTAQAIYGARLVDDLRSTNEQLVETQQQAMRQERLCALGQMASGITHDINNALSPVIGFSDMLLQESSELSEDSRKLLQLIRLAALDISRIVERMRQMYRDREAAVAEVGVVDLRQIVKETIELTRPTWQDRPNGEIRITTEFGRAIPPVSGIDTEIREALTNLVLNAVDAMPSGGNIEIALSSDPNTEAENAPDPTQVTISVKDGGTGMSPETAQRAIEPFFTTKGDAGTGLGLPMVQQVMERHQGALKISANSPTGTIVELTFPIKNERVVATREASDGSSAPESLKVLVVDDEPMLRMVVEEMLSAEGHSAISADGGPEASELILEHMKSGDPFNVIITDIEMPKLNGRMLADFVENNSPDTDVIFMTGYTDDRIDLDNVATRVIGVIHKPPRLADINALLSVAAMNFSPLE
jgi:signal transduction histidine kinase/CheY-like chemotaxis protein